MLIVDVDIEKLLEFGGLSLICDFASHTFFLTFLSNGKKPGRKECSLYKIKSTLFDFIFGNYKRSFQRSLQRTQQKETTTLKTRLGMEPASEVPKTQDLVLSLFVVQMES